VLMGLLYLATFLAFDTIRGNDDPMFSDDTTENVKWGIFFNIFTLAFIGDGDAWNALAGLRGSWRWVGEGLVMFSTLVFSVVMLNLVIAKYCSVYEELAPKLELNFWEMRCKVSFNRLLGHNHMKDMWSSCLCKSVLSHNVIKKQLGCCDEAIGGCHSCRRMFCISIPIILVLVSMAILGILKCAFGGMPIPGLAEFFCIICCTMCPLTLEFLIMDWCMEPFDNGNEEDQFLWICHRKDYDSDFLAGTLEEAIRERIVDSRFQTLKGLCDKNKKAIDTVQNNVTTLNEHVTHVKEQVAAVQASVNKILEVVQAGQPGTNEQVVTVQAGEDETLEVVQVWQPGKNEPAATVQASVDEISEVVQAGQPG